MYVLFWGVFLVSEAFRDCFKDRARVVVFGLDAIVACGTTGAHPSIRRLAGVEVRAVSVRMAGTRGASCCVMAPNTAFCKRLEHAFKG